MKNIFLIILICLIFGVDEKSVSFSNTGTSLTYVVTKHEIPYEILKIRCTETNNCFILAFVKSQYFNKKNMTELANQLSEEFKDKTTVSIALFDNKDLVKLYVEGKKEIRELYFDARGRYQRVDDKEFLIFSKKRKLGDLSNSEVIKIQN